MNERRHLTVVAILGAIAMTAVFASCSETETSGDVPTRTTLANTPTARRSMPRGARSATTTTARADVDRCSATAEMLTRYEDVADEISVVRRGIGEMPAFRERLTDAEIAAVVEYTRTQLVSED